MNSTTLTILPRRRRLNLAAIGLCAAALYAFALFVHPFLALNEPVDADTLVVEGWVPDYVRDGAIREIQRGAYAHVFAAGMGPDARDAVRYIARVGVDRSILIDSTAPATIWNRTSHMARAVRDRMHSLGIKPKGVNVLTLGPHGRQSRLAYQRMLGPETPVGVITIPKNDYDPARWWASAAGIKKTTKDFAGWLKEVLVGLRS
jgi:hypothetical protein